jgi:hypothetical protein
VNKTTSPFIIEGSWRYPAALSLFRMVRSPSPDK